MGLTAASARLPRRWLDNLQGANTDGLSLLTPDSGPRPGLKRVLRAELLACCSLWDCGMAGEWRILPMTPSWGRMGVWGGHRPRLTSSSATPIPTGPGRSGSPGSWRRPVSPRCWRRGTSDRVATSFTRCNRTSSRPAGPSRWSLLRTSVRGRRSGVGVGVVQPRRPCSSVLVGH